MKERPILFSGPMVNAILEGRKTQDRMVVKPQLPEGVDTLVDVPYENRWWAAVEVDNQWGREFHNPGSEFQHNWKCPCGITGDRLWVRETWQHTTATDSDSCVAYKADSSARYSLADQCGQGDFVAVGEECEPLFIGKWRPSIFMPRWASRITLEVVGVRVERLCFISFADCRAEGMREDYCESCPQSEGEGTCYGEKWHFVRTWESINGAGSWDANPWVWVVEFQRVTND